MAETEEWSSDSNEAVEVSLVRAGGAAPETIAAFHPRFTYPIFGEEESIFGYQGLRIKLRFTAHDLQPNLEVTWDKKFTPVGDTKAADIEEQLKDWLPESSFDKAHTFDAHVQNDNTALDFKPPGSLITTYKKGSKFYEVWSGRLTDPDVQNLVRRMQIFVPFFIEGGTYVNLDDPEWTISRWTIFFLYEKLSSPPAPLSSTYSICGYATAYRYYLYGPVMPRSSLSANSHPISRSTTQTFSLPLSDLVTPFSLPSRERISQFIILPPFQGQGHGNKLYNTLVSSFTADPTVVEITVEDPNEAFDDLRDYCDLARLRASGALAQLKINTSIVAPKRRRVPISQIIDRTIVEELRLKNKIAPRQFDRLVEMHLLSTIPARNRQAARITRKANTADERDRAYYFWRLLVKQRLYKHNRDQLAQLDRLDRIDKLEETLGNVEGDYVRLLRGAERAVEEESNGTAPETSSAERTDRGKKRVVVDDDEDEEVEEGPVAKKAKT